MLRVVHRPEGADVFVVARQQLDQHRGSLGQRVPHRLARAQTLVPERRDGAARTRMVAVPFGEITLDERDERIGAFSPGMGCRSLPTADRVRDAARDGGGSEPLLGAEPAVQAAISQPGRLGERVHTDAVEPALAEQPGGGGYDPLPMLRRLLARHPHSALRHSFCGADT